MTTQLQLINIVIITVSNNDLLVFKKKKITPPPGGLEPPTFRLTAERASRLRHGGLRMQPLNITSNPNLSDKNTA